MNSEVPADGNTGPRVLFVTAGEPALSVGGGGTATRNLIDLLRSAPIRARVEVEPLRRRPPILPRPLRQAAALARSIFSALPSTALYDLVPGAQGRIAKRISCGSWDLVVIDSSELFFLAELIPPGIPGLGITHNVEFSLFRAQTVALRALPLVGQIFARDLAKLERVERQGVVSLGRIVCLSRADEAVLRAIDPLVMTLALPTSFSHEPYCRPDDRPIGRPIKLGFLAKYSWWPNVAAVEWFVERILDRMPVGKVQLLLFGPGAERFAGRHPAIRVRGFVPDVAQVWSESDIIICPMVAGSGLNVKFVEAIYNRCPVLATPFAARGLPEFSDPAVMLLAESDEWLAFLASPAAEQLARLRPAAGTAALFSASEAGQKLSDFLNRDR